MSKPMNFYWEDNIRRTLDEIKTCSLKNEFACQHPPLLDIPLENVVLDELHLMLRITGKRTNVIFYIFSELRWFIRFDQPLPVIMPQQIN